MFKFHKIHGRNIELRDNRLIAVRTQSFANALVFSQRPLEANEVFLFEIEEHENGWAGNIRCGVTLHNPREIMVPQYLLPDLYQLGKSFVYAIKPISDDPFNDADVCVRDDNEFKKNENAHNVNKVKAQSYIMETNIKKCTLDPTISIADNNLVADPTCNPCSLKSRIGFFISSDRCFYILINGVQFGPCARNIPEYYNVYAALDLYGKTKAVRIINCVVPRLSVLCKDALWKFKTEEEVAKADIPQRLKRELLLFYEQSIDFDHQYAKDDNNRCLHKRLIRQRFVCRGMQEEMFMQTTTGIARYRYISVQRTVNGVEGAKVSKRT